MPSFKAYVRISDNRYRENYGLSYDQFTIGQKFKHRPGITISQQDNKDEALDTINNAQLHYDEHYAEQTEWKHCLGVSTLTLQKLMGATWKTFGRKYRVLTFDDIAMTHPVFGGDTLYAESEITGKSEYPSDPNLGIIHVVTAGVNQTGTMVAKIQYQLLVYKNGKHPLDHGLPTHAFDLTEEKFNSHRRLEDGSLMEEVGIYYEDLTVNETYEHFPAKTFSEDESRLHSLRSLEWNPLYADSQYIKNYYGGKSIINESYLVGAITALTTRTFGRVVANLQWKNIQLPLLVYAGDTIHCESTILLKRESNSRPTEGIMEATTKAFNQKNQLVCSYERHFLIYKKGLGPYKAAGY
ncbi:MAG: hypothetical protein A3E84_01390 [Gammaproteobacteria bacterium RIFCSPHIGHO2_12_FULL_42_13]|nr:MAG: hypothetical protein A3E84_01390 [Gammaproteobacteria bacterium RIFCSPHIGHO2_12_FULL_42_13]